MTVELLAGLLNDSVLLHVVRMLLGWDFQDRWNDATIGVDLRSEVLLCDLVKNRLRAG